MKKEFLATLIVASTISGGCAPPSDSKAYYEASTNKIHYRDGAENDESIVLHETEHQKRANEMGRFVWGIRYWLDPEFACAEEIAANMAGDIKPYSAHTACAGIIFSEEIAKK